MLHFCSNLSKMNANQNIRDLLQTGIKAYLGGETDKLCLNPPVQEQPADVLNLIHLNVEATKDLDAKQKNLREAVKRALNKLEAMDQDTVEDRARLSGVLERLDVVEDSVAVTNAKLESHIEVSDQRHDLSEHQHALAVTRYLINKDKIADLTSMLDELRASTSQRHDVSDQRHDVSEVRHDESDQRHDVSDQRHEESEHRHDVTDARFFDVMQYVVDLRARFSKLEARADEHEDDLDYVLPLVKRYALDWQKAQIAMEGSLLDLD